MREHNASAAHSQIRGSGGDWSDHDFRAGAGEAGSRMMLSQPVARIAETIRRPRQIERVAQGVAGGRPFGNRGLVEYAEAEGRHCRSYRHDSISVANGYAEKTPCGC